MAQQNITTELKLSLSHLKASLGLEKNIHSLVDPLNLNVRAELLLGLEGLAGPLNGQMSIACGRVTCHVGPHHLYVLDTLFSDLMKSFRSGPEAAAGHQPENMTPGRVGAGLDDDVGEAFYDDLRLGTFSFSEDSDARRSIPPPYQAVYGPNTLTWSYPKPRTLTKMVILPIPLTQALRDQENQTDKAVECQLLYWSRIRSGWILYQSFLLTEGSVTHVDLPLFSDRSSEYAETWRLEVFPFGSDVRSEICCSLVSAMRVDSFYSRRMLPNFQVVVDIKSLALVLHNHLTYAATRLGAEWRGLSLEENYPRDQAFLRLVADAVGGEVCLWRQLGGGTGAGAIKSNLRFRGSVHYTDLSYLAQHTLLAPTDVGLKLQLENRFVDLFADLGVAEVSFGAFALHVVKQSSQLWQQVERRLLLNSSVEVEEEEELVAMAQLVLVNESSQTLVYGQSFTDETLRIGTRRLAMYCWRSQKAR
jgi:hypothetical protein